MLLNEVGENLKPKVRCILQLANSGAGNPDGEFYHARPGITSRRTHHRLKYRDNPDYVSVYSVSLAPEYYVTVPIHLGLREARHIN
jgi:hypothetical protein